MGKAKTDPKIEARVCELRLKGLSLNELVKETGVAKGTIRGILERNKIPAPSKNDARTPAPAIKDDRADSNRTPNRTPDDEMGGLTQGMIAKNLVTFLNASKRGINETRESRVLKERDKTQIEIQWMHIYGMGIKMGIKATGLSAEALRVAVDDYEIDVADALERFNSRYRKEEQDAGD